MKAMIAEDDQLTRKALASILTQEGWTVIEAPDGVSAVERFRAHKPELVCLDIMMPGKSGYEVCREIRKIDETVPVLFISAKSEELDKVLGLELGADDFIAKPFGINEVLARVRAVLRRCARQTASQAGTSAEKSPVRLQDFEDFQFGNWLVKARELRLVHAEITVDISLRELRMLNLLKQQQGKVIDRQEFFNVCWDMEQVPLSRSLDQGIVRLRKKLDTLLNQTETIQTVQGIGYRYCPS